MSGHDAHRMGREAVSKTPQLYIVSARALRLSVYVGHCVNGDSPACSFNFIFSANLEISGLSDSCFCAVEVRDVL